MSFNYWDILNIIKKKERGRDYAVKKKNEVLKPEKRS